MSSKEVKTPSNVIVQIIFQFVCICVSDLVCLLIIGDFRNAFAPSNGIQWLERERSLETLSDLASNAENVAYTQVMNFMTWVKDRIDSSSVGTNQLFQFERQADGVLGTLGITIKLERENVHPRKLNDYCSQTHMKYFLKNI